VVVSLLLLVVLIGAKLVVVFMRAEPIKVILDNALNHRVDLVLDQAGHADLILSELSRVDQVGECGNRLRVSDDTLDILNDVVEAESGPKGLIGDVLEGEVGAGVRLVAADDTRRQNVAVLLDVPQGDVMHFDKRLALTGDQRVKHASRIARGTWLVLLLGADVD